MHFYQSDTQTSTGATRECLSNSFQRFGSYLALTLRFAGYLMGKLQNFSLHNSMMKKLYTYGVDSDDSDNEDEKKKKKKGKGKAPGSLHTSPTASANVNGQPMTESEDKLNYEMAHRNPMSYSAARMYALDWFSNPWCLCCRKTPRRKDKLFAEGRKMLFAELDILEIIKKLRVNQFTSDCYLNQAQRDMVNFHQDYKVCCSDDVDSEEERMQQQLQAQA